MLFCKTSILLLLSCVAEEIPLNVAPSLISIEPSLILIFCATIPPLPSTTTWPPVIETFPCDLSSSSGISTPKLPPSFKVILPPARVNKPSISPSSPTSTVSSPFDISISPLFTVIFSIPCIALSVIFTLPPLMVIGAVSMRESVSVSSVSSPETANVPLAFIYEFVSLMTLSLTERSFSAPIPYISSAASLSPHKI